MNSWLRIQALRATAKTVICKFQNTAERRLLCLNYFARVSVFNVSSSSKLSATVPAFIPKKTYTGVTSGGLSSELVIKSTLSPFVPEFHPSGSFAPLLSAPYQPTCSLLQHNSKQAYLKHQKVDLKEVCRSLMEMFLKTSTALKNGSGYF